MEWRPISEAPKELKFSEYILGTDGKTVFAVEVVKNAKEAKRWGKEQMRLRPWETRQ